MALFEIVTSHVGESYVRVYCWERSEDMARARFAKTYGRNYTIQSVTELFSESDEPFISYLSDSGFKMDSASKVEP